MSEFIEHGFNEWDVNDTALEYGIVAHLGESIGEAFDRAAQKQAIYGVAKRIGDLPLILRCAEEDYDTGCHEYEKRITVREAARQIIETDWPQWNPDILNGVTTLDELRTAYASSYERCDGVHFISLLTEPEAKKRRREKEYKRMEAIASGFAAECGHGICTWGFLRELDCAIRRVKSAREVWNNPEVRMEEFAACRYAGVGSEVYFDDLNFENGVTTARLMIFEANRIF